MPEIPNGSFAKKLYATYLSYLPKEKISYPLNMHVDSRGSFTEVLDGALWAVQCEYHESWSGESRTLA